jgi:hypothetical protein
MPVRWVDARERKQAHFLNAFLRRFRSRLFRDQKIKSFSIFVKAQAIENKRCFRLQAYASLRNIHIFQPHALLKYALGMQSCPCRKSQTFFLKGQYFSSPKTKKKPKTQNPISACQDKPFRRAKRSRIFALSTPVFALLVHIPKFRNGTGKILANASTPDFSGASDIILGYAFNSYFITNARNEAVPPSAFMA